MKKTNKLFKTVFGVIFLGVALYLTSCKDDFSEEDFLKQQYELAEQKSVADHARELAVIALNHTNELAVNAVNAEAQEALLKLQQQIAQETRDEYLLAYRNAGLLVKANIVLLDGVTKKAISGASVSVFGKEVTTSAQGVANFTDIPIGGGNVVLSATNYYDAVSPATIAYQTPEIAGSEGLPIQNTVSATLNMVAKGNVTESSVTVNGVVTLDKDLTNASTENPLAATIAIDYLQALQPSTSSSGISFHSYLLDNPDFQPAVVDPATGEYTITVPAITGIKLVLPDLEEEITYIKANPVYDALTNPDVDAFLLEKETGVFTLGTSNSPSYQASVTTSDLYEYEFEGLKGSGFDLDFKQLFNNLYNIYSSGTNNFRSFQFTAGSGYNSIPTVALVANGTDSIEEDKIYLDTDVTISDLSITGGSYPASTTKIYHIDVAYTNSSGNDSTITIGNVEIEADASGDLVNVDKLTISENTPFNLMGINSIEKYTLTGLADADQPNISQTFSSVVIQKVSIVQGATKGNYTSWPSVTFTGGTPAIAANFTIDSNRGSNWEVSIANNGTAYDVLPKIKYTNIYGNELDLDNEFSNPITNNLVLNSGGTISLNATTLTTGYMRPSEIATVVEDLLPENSSSTLSLSFTNNIDKDNDVSSINFSSNTNYYKTKPVHKMVNKYTWVNDATTPLELDIVYYNDVAPLSASIKPGTGKGYMNPIPQTPINSNNFSISSSDKGKTITQNFMYGVGKLKD